MALCHWAGSTGTRPSRRRSGPTHLGFSARPKSTIGYNSLPHQHSPQLAAIGWARWCQGTRGSDGEPNPGCWRGRGSLEKSGGGDGHGGGEEHGNGSNTRSSVLKGYSWRNYLWVGSFLKQ
jgi:hypothetical protein